MNFINVVESMWNFIILGWMLEDARLPDGQGR